MRSVRFVFFVTFVGVFSSLVSDRALADVPQHVFETFTGFDSTPYGDYTFNDFAITNGMWESTLERRIDGIGVRLNLATGAALAYVGPGEGGKSGGVGTVSFDWRAWNAAVAVNYNVQYRMGNSGGWTTFGVIQTAGDGPSSVPPVEFFTYDLDIPQNGAQIRVVNVSGDRLVIDNFSITDYDGPLYDPAISIDPPSLDFGAVDLFDELILQLEVSNIGFDNDLIVLTNSEIVSNEDGLFTLMTELPLVIPPDESDFLAVRFRSPVVEGLYDSASLLVRSNAENPAQQEVAVPLSAMVTDALAGSPLAILDDYSDGPALEYNFVEELQFSVGEDPVYETTQLIAASNGVATPNHSYASTDFGVAIPGWAVGAEHENEWIGWMRSARSNTGWEDFQFGVGAVLACDRPDFNHPLAKGYAVLFRGGESPNRAVSLVRFEEGIRDGAEALPPGTTEIVTMVGDPGTNGMNFRVSLKPTGFWELRISPGAPFTEEQALNLGNYTIDPNQVSNSDDTFTGSDFRYAGWVWAHSNSPHLLSRAFFGNLGAGMVGTTDTSPPEALSVSRFSPASGISTGGPVSWEVQFNKPLIPSTVSVSDFEIFTTEGELDGAEVTGFAFTDFDTVLVEAAVGSGNKTLGLRVPASAGMEDRFGNVYSSLIESDGGNLIVVDQTIPGVSVSAPSVDVTANGPVQYTVSFVDAETVLMDSSHVDLLTTGTVGATISVEGSGTEQRLVTLSDITGEGEVAIRILDGSAESMGGNPSATSDFSPAVVVDKTPPTILEVFPAPGSAVAALDSVSITFSEPVTISGAVALMIDSGNASTVSGTGAGPYLFGGFPSLGDGLIPVELDNSMVTDAAGNVLTGSGWSYTLNSSLVGVTMTSPQVLDGAATNQSPILLTVGFSEDISGLAPGMFAGSGYTPGMLTGGPSVYQLEVIPTIEGSVQVTLPSEVVFATAPPGNGNAAADFSFVFDATPPTILYSTESNWVFQQPVLVEYTATDSLSGVAEVSLLVREPGSEVLQVGDTSGDAAGSFSFTATVTGRHQFGVVATDVAGNQSPMELGDILEVLVALDEGGPLTLEIPAGSNVEVVYPLGDNQRVHLTFDEVMTTGTVTVESFLGAGDAAVHGLDSNRLAGQFFRILADVDLEFSTVTLAFLLEESAFGSEVTDPASLTSVYIIRDGILSTKPTSQQPGGVIAVDGVTGFSDWYPGMGGLNVRGWMDLME